MQRFLRLVWENAQDFEHVLLHNGWAHKVYLDGYFDRPVHNEVKETITDGYGKEATNLLQLEERIRFQALNVVDNQLFAFRQIQKYGTVSIAFKEDGWANSTIEDFTVENVEPQGNCLNKVTFSYRRTITTMAGCETDYSIVA